MSWTNEYDGIFFISLATLMTGAFGVALRYCLRSKCEHCSLCFGLIKIDRRVDLETQEHIREIELGINEESQEEQKMQERRPSHVKELIDKKDNLDNL